MSPSPLPGRRRLLGAGVAAAVAGFFGASGRSFATVADLERMIALFGEGAAPVNGGLVLSTPEIAENGHSVPVSFSIESPMTADEHVEAVMILAPANPNTRVATFRFTPASGAARASTRMRLARTQDVVAVARMSDGSLRSATPSRAWGHDRWLRRLTRRSESPIRSEDDVSWQPDPASRFPSVPPSVT